MMITSGNCQASPGYGKQPGAGTSLVAPAAWEVATSGYFP